MVVAIPKVVRMTVVAVEPTLVIVVFNIEHIEVAVRVSCCIGYRPYHHPLNTLGVVSYSA